jgi:hypothetical protein
MAYFIFQWTPDIVAHCAEHDVTREDFEEAFNDPVRKMNSDSSGKEALFGYDMRGRLLFCVYETLSDVDILPVTAYEVDERL